MSAARTHHGPFYTDIVADPHGSGVWFYVVQRTGSADILAIGSCDSEEAARKVATATMKQLSAAAHSQRASSAAG
jgi:hypothetical protein